MGIAAQAEIVVHRIVAQLGHVLCCCLVLRGRRRRCRSWGEKKKKIVVGRGSYLPPVEPDRAAVEHPCQDLARRLVVRIGGAPVQRPRQVIARAERENGDGRRRGQKLGLLNYREHPAHRAVATAH